MSSHELLSLPYHKICAEIYKRGIYTRMVTSKYGIHKKQEEALGVINNLNVTTVGYGGSGRSGKSWFAAEWLIMNCLAYPGTGWGLARKELKNLKRTTLRTLWKVCKKYKLQRGFKTGEGDYFYNSAEGTIKFTNGSEIFLIDTKFEPSDELYTRYGGLELTGVVIDESNESPYKAIEVLKTRCGFRMNIEYNIPARSLETFNPDKGHVYTRFYLPFKENRETPEKRFIRALPSDNPDPAVALWTKQQLAEATEITIQRLVYGNFEYDETKDRLISHAGMDDYFKNGHVKAQGLKFMTIDVARMGRDKTVVRVWHGYRVIEKLYISKGKLNKQAEAIIELIDHHDIPMSRVIADEDGVGGGLVDILDCWGFVGNARPIGIGNYQNLKAQCTFVMADMINNQKVAEEIDDPDLESRIKQEMDWVRERGMDDDQKRKVIRKEEVKQALGRSPDDWDSIMMRAFFELGSEI